MALAVPVSAQASSPKHFLVAAEPAGGALTARSTRHRLDGNLGGAFVAPRMSAGGLLITGGFVTAFAVPVAGRPWLVGASPSYLPSRGRGAVTLVGAELNLGSGTRVQVAGRPARVRSISRDRIVCDLPLETEPGWQPVSVSNGVATTTLARGIGVLPLLETPAGPPRRESYDLIYRGTRFDRAAFAFSLTESPVPFRLPGYFHALRLHPAGMLVVGPFSVTDAGGILSIRLRVPLGPAVYSQALALSNGSAYRPGSFTNTIRL